jgi:hypothetical protein
VYIYEFYYEDSLIQCKFEVLRTRKKLDERRRKLDEMSQLNEIGREKEIISPLSAFCYVQAFK